MEEERREGSCVEGSGDTHQHTEEDVMSEVPVDRGFAWVVLFASTVIITVHAGVLKSFGIFFIEILKVYGGEVSTTSLISGVQFAFYCLGNVPVMIFALRRVSVRSCQIVGVLMCSVAYGLSSLATTLPLLILFNSILTGLSTALIVPTVLVLLPKYFDKHLSLANGILMSGFALGGIIMPPTLQLIVDSYTLSGAFLMTSGIILNTLPMALLQRPPSFFERKKKSDHIEEELRITLRTENPKEHEFLHYQRSPKLRPKVPTSDVDNGTCTVSSMPNLPLLSKSERQNSDGVIKRRNSLTVHDDATLLRSKDVTHIGNGDISHSSLRRFLSNVSVYVSNSAIVFPMVPPNKSILNLSQGQEDEMSSDYSGRSGAIVGFCSLFCDRLLILYIFIYSLGTTGPETIHIFLPSFAKENGDSSNVAILVSILSVCDFIGTILSGYLGDLKSLKRHYIIMFSMTITTILPQFIELYNEFWKIALFALIYGTSAGMMYALCAPILMDIIPDEKFPGGLALLVFIKGAWLSAVVPVMGYLRDMTGYYYASIHLIGATSCTGLLLTFLLVVQMNREDRHTDINIVIERPNT